ncbi:class I SAM-dependent methyltransferase [Rubripirellula lacrimiformis]|nr:class I SAM-dependent methyltransferase [Rubripirellula lacrimiformis]
MIVQSPRGSLERTKNFVSFVRDGYRSACGKQRKHTVGAQRSVADRDLEEWGFHSNTVSGEEWALLSQMVAESAKFDGPIVEIGVLAGRTTQRIASAKSSEQKILAVDNFCWNPWGLSADEQWSLVCLSLGYLVENDDVEICRTDKNEFFESYDGPAPALVFADAMHDYEETKKDLLWAKKVGAGIICGHDYSDDFPGVKQIVDELGGPRLLAGSVFVL